MSEVIRLCPDDAGAYYRRGKVYYHQKEYDKALADYRKIIKLAHRHRKFYDRNYAYFHRGKAYLYKGDHEKSQTDFTEAFRIIPGLSKLYRGYYD